METGDGGVYSTVKDLLRFDQALYTHALVGQQTLAEAFTPAPVRKGLNTYGFGWNIAADATGKRVWHKATPPASAPSSNVAWPAESQSSC